jgi:hypothetical protein
MRRQIVILAAALVAVAGGVSAQDIRRPPATNTCSECAPVDSYWCELYPQACADCWLTCGEQPGEPPRRTRPTGAPYDPWLGDYRLPHVISVTQVYHEDVPWAVEPLRHMTNLELAHEAYIHGFYGLKVWMQEGPFNGSEFSWTTSSGSLAVDTGGGGEGEDMARFWREAPQDILIVRPQWYAWSGSETIEQLRVTYMDADFYAIASRLYREIGYRDMVVVLCDWEQDWQYETWPEWTLAQLERRQEGVERARREAYLELGYRPDLRVMHAAIVNRYPANGGEEGRTLAEQIPKLEHRPDLIGLSYWSNGTDPVETLNWLSEVTQYPPRRIYVDEFGADEGCQAKRFADYISAFREWGITGPICIWLWKQTWCDPEHNRGLWQQAQPCVGKPVFTDPTAGYYELQNIMNGG